MDIDFKKTETNQNQNQNQNHRFSNGDSGSDTAFIGSWSSSSSSSFLNTSFESELDSNEAELIDEDDNDEFMAELTRKMTDYMLEENDDSNQKQNFQEATHNNQNHEKNRPSYADTVKKSIVVEKQLPPPIQLYKVENQLKVEVQSNKGKMNESTLQHVKHLRHEQMYSNRGNGVHGSGMRAIFLGGLSSRNVVGGTGVFLPRSPRDATDQTRKKSGCSTVLVPTRVLEALEQHFHNMESLSPSNKTAQTRRHRQVKKEKTQTQTQTQTQEADSIDHQDSKLPQEWIY